MNTINEKMLETAFKKGYSEGYIDDEGFLLKNIPMEDFSALKKHGMVKQVGQEFKLCAPIKKAETYYFTFNDWEKAGITPPEDDDAEEQMSAEWSAKLKDKVFEIAIEELIKALHNKAEVKIDRKRYHLSELIDVGAINKDAIRKIIESTCNPLGGQSIEVMFTGPGSAELGLEFDIGDESVIILDRTISF